MAVDAAAVPVQDIVLVSVNSSRSHRKQEVQDVRIWGKLFRDHFTFKQEKRNGAFY